MYEIIKKVKAENIMIIEGKEKIVLTEQELKDLLRLYRSKTEYKDITNNIFI